MKHRHVVRIIRVQWTVRWENTVPLGTVIRPVDRDTKLKLDNPFAPPPTGARPVHRLRNRGYAIRVPVTWTVKLNCCPPRPVTKSVAEEPKPYSEKFLHHSVVKGRRVHLLRWWCRVIHNYVRVMLVARRARRTRSTISVTLIMGVTNHRILVHYHQVTHYLLLPHLQIIPNCLLGHPTTKSIVLGKMVANLPPVKTLPLT